MNAFEHPLLLAVPADKRRLYPLAQATFELGKSVYAAGQKVDHVYFVLSGSLQLIHRDPQLGVRTIAHTVGAGGILGDVIEGEAVPSLYDVKALEPAEAVVMALDDFQQLIAGSPEFSRALLRDLAARARLLEARSMSAERFDVTRVVFDSVLLDRLTAQYMLSKKVLPVAQQGQTATVAYVGRDSNAVEADMRRFLQAGRVVAYRITQRDFERVYREAVQPCLRPGTADDENAWYRGLQKKEYRVHYETGAELPTDASRKETELDGAGVVALTSKFIGEALDLGASDIHFEPHPGGLDVRYRLDGELVKRPDRVAPAYLFAVLSRVKVLAGLDIAEKRKPQDGRITVTCMDKTVDVRVSTVPTRFGEKIVMRILDPTNMLLDLETLIDAHDVYRSVRWMLDQPYGMILIAGPTGAGKTTTVYSMLLDCKKAPVNIMTVEDPVEYSLRGITQVQRNLYVGLDFPNAVRSFLRQDPDVIVVGETRDAETARASLEAGLTGHLVITTIHANNVFATVFRLREMGMEPFVIANSVMGVLAQRLVRRVCVKCSRTHQYHRSLVDPLGLKGLGEPQGDYYMFSKGVGCVACNGKGYKGRAAVFESLRVTDELKPVLAAGVSFAEMEEAARRLDAYHSMQEYAASLLHAGLTTPEEISRVLFTEGQ